jgi:hypothetical protein
MGGSPNPSRSQPLHPAAPPPELAAGIPRGREEGGDVASFPLLTVWLERARPLSAAEGGVAPDLAVPWLDPAV